MIERLGKTQTEKYRFGKGRGAPELIAHYTELYFHGDLLERQRGRSLHELQKTLIRMGTAQTASFNDMIGRLAKKNNVEAPQNVEIIHDVSRKYVCGIDDYNGLRVIGGKITTQFQQKGVQPPELAEELARFLQQLSIDEQQQIRVALKKCHEKAKKIALVSKP